MKKCFSFNFAVVCNKCDVILTSWPHIIYWHSSSNSHLAILASKLHWCLLYIAGPSLVSPSWAVNRLKNSLYSSKALQSNMTKQLFHSSGNLYSTAPVSRVVIFFYIYNFLKMCYHSSFFCLNLILFLLFAILLYHSFLFFFLCLFIICFISVF